VEPRAAIKPPNLNVGEFQDAAPIPIPISSKASNAKCEGNELHPSKSTVNRTVISGMPHFDVYVNEIPILSNAILFSSVVEETF
jgi:hypothetical protein